MLISQSSSARASVRHLDRGRRGCAHCGCNKHSLAEGFRRQPVRPRSSPACRNVKASLSGRETVPKQERGPDQPTNAFDSEIALLAIPALAALAADPIASLVDTAFVGRLGSVQVAACGTALSIAGSFQKLLNIPLLAVTTNNIANADSETEKASGRSPVGAASSAALSLGALIGALQAVALVTLSEPLLATWGVPGSSALFADALTYLRIKAIGAPFLVMLLVAQGAFRGLGDTRTPLYATLLCNTLNIALNYVLLFVLHWGVAGSAWATVAAEAGAASALMIALNRMHPLRIPSQADISRLEDFAGPVGLLSLRTGAITAVFALATAMAARTDVVHAAGHQICLQLWLASSLLADALAVAAQTLVARLLASQQSDSARAVAKRVMQLATVLGVILAAGMGLGSATLISTFTTDASVQKAIRSILPIVIVTQPLNAVAFAWDGVLYGAGGFGYAAKAMPVCAFPALACILGSLLSQAPDTQLLAVWGGLTLLMAMRSLTIWLPFRLGWEPFRNMYEEAKKQA